MNDRTTFLGIAFGTMLLVAAGIGFAFYEHEQEGPAEKIGEAIDEAAGK